MHEEDLKEKYLYLYSKRNDRIDQLNFRIIQIITDGLNCNEKAWKIFGTRLLELNLLDIEKLECEESPTKAIINQFRQRNPQATLMELVQVFYEIPRLDICHYMNLEIGEIEKGSSHKREKSESPPNYDPGGIPDLPTPTPPPSPSLESKEPQELRSNENNWSCITNKELDEVGKKTSQSLVEKIVNSLPTPTSNQSSCQLNQVTPSQSIHESPDNYSLQGARPKSISLSQSFPQTDNPHDQQSIRSWPEENIRLISSSPIASTNSSSSPQNSSSPENSYTQSKPKQQRGATASANSLQSEVKQKFKKIPLPIPEPSLNFPRLFVIYEKNIENFVKHLLVNLTENKLYFQVDNSMRHFYKHGFQYNNIVEWLDECFKFEFVLVCISSSFKLHVENITEEVVQKSNENSLNLRFIYSLMLHEYYRLGSRNYRFIPLLMKGAKVSDVPTWLQGRRIFRWPEDYHDLFLFLLGCQHSGPAQGKQPNVKKQPRK